ncbi:MAG: FAD-binding oxidoreductase [Vicinamibacterales bacterium]
MGGTLTLRIVGVRTATPGTRVVRLALDGQPFEFRAGQAVLLGAAGLELRLPYSVASAPEEAVRTGVLEFLMKVDAAGDPGPHLRGLARGQRIEAVGPFGSFVFPAKPAERRFLFIAGGTGIAPLRSMLRHAILSRVAGEFAVSYSARTPSDFAYGAELRRLARAGRIRLELRATREAPPRWRGERGRVGQPRLAPLVTDPATLCFICGPPSMLVEVPPILTALGVASSRIRMETW